MGNPADTDLLDPKKHAHFCGNNRFRCYWETTSCRGRDLCGLPHGHGADGSLYEGLTRAAAETEFLHEESIMGKMTQNIVWKIISLQDGARIEQLAVTSHSSKDYLHR